MSTANPPSRASHHVGATAIIIVATVFFAVPIVAAAREGFTLPGRFFTLEPLWDVVDQAAFRHDLWTSSRLAVGTTLCSLVLMVPTVVWLHLRLPRWRPIAELVSVLPYVVPPIAMVAGVSKAFHSVLSQVITDDVGLVPLYVVLAMPFTYRALDAGLGAIDVRTITEAARGLGASWRQVLWSVLLPNLRTALLGASFLTVAVVLGEYTIASLLLHETYPVFLARVGGSEPKGAPALATLTIAFTWAMLGLVALAGRRRGDRALPPVA